MEYLYQQAGREFVLSKDSTPTDDVIEDDLINELDEGFVDNSVEAPSISEDLLTVGAGAPDDEEEEEEGDEDDDDDDDDEEEEVCIVSITYNHCIRLMPLLVVPSGPPPGVPPLSMSPQTPEGYLAGTRLDSWQRHLWSLQASLCQLSKPRTSRLSIMAWTTMTRGL